LIARGSAYCGSDGNIYFDARSADSYGYISGNKLDSLKPGHRYEYTGDGGKNFHADWALWKLAGKRSEMIWDSPWGAGFPGWHIECSAMSLNLLGDSVDIHVGGIDLRFPHHEDERAQTNALAGKSAGEEVVHNWIHGEHLLFEGKKMAKSSGNVLLVSDITERGLDPLSLRLALLENRYRSQIDMTWQTITAADATLKRWRKAMALWGTGADVKFDPEIHGYFMNDLETAKALLRLRAIEKDESIGSQDKRALFLFADQVLALDLNRTVGDDVDVELSAEAAALLEEREAARAAGNWAESDRIRDVLAESGILVRDSKDGQSWELRP
jgi:cysteinyl-tRNA synthetase